MSLGEFHSSEQWRLTCRLKFIISLHKLYNVFVTKQARWLYYVAMGSEARGQVELPMLLSNQHQYMTVKCRRKVGSLGEVFPHILVHVCVGHTYRPGVKLPAIYLQCDTTWQYPMDKALFSSLLEYYIDNNNYALVYVKNWVLNCLVRMLSGYVWAI